MKKYLIRGYFLFGILLFSESYTTASVEISKGVIPEHYIVVLKDENVYTVSEVADKMADIHGIKVIHIYRHAIKGFSAIIPDDRLEDLKRDPHVRLLDVDRFVFAMSKQSGKHNSGDREKTPPIQIMPTGVDRVDAELNMISHPVDADIAILDTGIDLDHPDLNVVENVTFVKSERGGDDDNGHGSHVAGIAAAKANEIGVIGVAPGARLWAVKVLDRYGIGSWSSVIAGIDWITEMAEEIEVANMSFCGIGSDTVSALRIAIENSTAAGITYVVSAGNDYKDAKDCVPAAYDSVITVSAIADSDGRRWGSGANTSHGPDDVFATFSNFGADVDIAAPGVDILSCWKNGEYKTVSGTSMSAPHVAGAAAIFIVHNSAHGIFINAEIVRSALLYSGDYGEFAGDPDVFQEPLLNASGL